MLEPEKIRGLPKGCLLRAPPLSLDSRSQALPDKTVASDSRKRLSPIFQGLHRWAPLERIGKWRPSRAAHGLLSPRFSPLLRTRSFPRAVQPCSFLGSRKLEPMWFLLRVCPLSLPFGSVAQPAADPPSAVLPKAQYQAGSRHYFRREDTDQKCLLGDLHASLSGNRDSIGTNH